MEARKTEDRSISWNSLAKKQNIIEQILASKSDMCFDRGVRRCSVNKDYLNQMRPVF